MIALGEENQNMQPVEDRANDAGRDAKRQGQAKKTDTAKVNNKKKLIAMALIVILLFGIRFFMGNISLWKSTRNG